MVSISKIKALVIIFDQGNTLLMDPFLSVTKLQKIKFKRLFEGHGLSMDISNLLSQWMISNEKVHYPYAGHFYQEEPIIQDALRNLGIAEDIAAILGLELLREYRVGLRKIIEADPRTKEVRGTLQKLQANGKRLGVFSNDRIVALGFVLNVMGVRQYFDYIETSESLGVEKPDRRVFEHMIKYFNAGPSDLVYVGDDPVRDVEAAKAKGLKAVQYCVDIEKYQRPWRDYRVKVKWKPDAFINSFSELINIIE